MTQMLADQQQFSADEHYLKQELYTRVQSDPVLFEFLQRGSLDGIWYWDLENPEHEWMSPQFWQSLGYDPQSMPHLAESWQDLIHPDDCKLAIANFNQHCDDSTHPYDQIVRYRHKNGSTVWVRCRGMAIRDEQGKPIRMLGAHTDITALKQTEQKLQQSNKELSQFAHAASHDLKAPLRTIQTHLDVLQKRYGESLDERGQRLIDNSVDAAVRMTTLIQGLLEFSTLTNQAIQLKPIKTQTIVDEIIADLSKDIDDTRAVIHVDQLPDLVSDPLLLRQIFQNLINNALKYRREDIPPKIDVTGQSQAGRCRFAVRDNGVGIEAQYQDQIFELFTRLHTWSQCEGSGLGLGLCQKAVSYLGGQIWVESVPGEGSTFYFEIPEHQP
ncbi:MAG: ATP-binding protein [Cyanobacteria bacterium P01_A01_bin.17]